MPRDFVPTVTNHQWNIMQLKHFRILDVVDKGDDYHVTAEYEPTDPPICPECARSRMLRHGYKKQLYFGLPVHGKRVGMELLCQRYRCRHCGRTTLENLVGMNDRHFMTEQLVGWVKKQSLRRTFTWVANDLGVSEKTVRAICNEHIRFMQEDTHFPTPRYMGVDEIYFNRRSCAKFIAMDVEDKAVIEFLPRRRMEDVCRYFRNLPGKERVEVVCMDMWGPYRAAVLRELPQAKIVIDKFHVVRTANKCLDEFRKKIGRQLPDSERRRLTRKRFLLMKRNDRLETSQREMLDGLLAPHPLLAAAYRIKEEFYAIWDSESKSQALERYRNWFGRIDSQVAADFNPLTGALDNWE